MSDLLDRIKNLSPQKRERLLRELNRKQKGSEGSKIPIISRSEKIALSYAQERVWFLEQLQPESSAYHIVLTVRLRGNLAVERLASSFQALAMRHETLRTTIHEEGGSAYQITHAAWSVTLVAEAVNKQDVQALLTDEAVRPFHLAGGSLWRARLLQTGTEDYILSVVQHHLISDGWSIRLLVQELGQLYNDPTVSLPPLPVQYADFAEWQRQWLQGERLEQQLTYWREQLQDAPTLALPTDHARPAQRSYQGASYSFELSMAQTEALTRLCKETQVTLFMTLLSLFGLTLGRYSGQQDVVIGSPIANRTQPEIERVVGFFANTLALRVRWEPETRVRELLHKVHSLCLEAYTHQDVPFEKLVAELRPVRDLSRNPLFDVMFSLEQAQSSAPLVGLQLEAVEGQTPDAKFDLTLTMLEAEGQLSGTTVYNPALFDETGIQRLVLSFLRLSEQAGTDLDAPVGSLSLLSEAERAQIVNGWNQTQEPLLPLTVSALFEAQVRRSPEAVALIAEDETLTYAQLDGRANALAHHLVAWGVGSEQVVGLCVERSAQLVIALLGILKAGAAYLPLDPTYPAERLAAMLTQARVQVIVAAADLIDQLPGHEAHVVNLANSALRQAIATPPTVSAEPEQLAYVLFTSGSTGQPKGVAVQHQSLVNHMQWLQRAFPLQAADRVLQKTPFTFDASVWEFFAPLLAGAQLVMLPPQEHQNPVRLVAAIRAYQITTLQVVPSVLRLLLAEPDFGACVSLQRLFCGGEALPPDLCERLSATLPRVQLINLYGPTEATIDTTYQVVESAAARVPIGRPISNTQVYVLDESLAPVPVGVVGELYIGGSALARGYLHQPALTAWRFVPSPFTPGQRLYRTGDWVCWLPSGALDYRARLDQQVKLRGLRIELTEIQAALLHHPAVQAATVLMREPTPGQAVLVAYLIASEPTPEPAALRDWLASTLPSYMLPTAFVFLSAFPLTANGKLNIAALPLPSLGNPVDSTVVGPKSVIEELLIHAFEELLAVEPIRTDTNFFEVGGHSLIAMQLSSRINKIFSVNVPIRIIFEYPTVAGLAEQIGLLTQTIHRPMPPRPERENISLSYAQERVWVLERLQPGSSAYHIIIAVRMRGALIAEGLEASLQALVARHESLRTTIREDDGKAYQIVHPVWQLALVTEIVSEHAVQSILDDEAVRPFQLEDGALWRVRLLQISPAEHVFIVVQHHLISDGWSIRLLVHELGYFYNDPATVLPPLRVQYADYAVWQRQWLQGERLEQQLSYWREQLQDAPILTLPTDHARPAQLTRQGASYSFQLSTDQVAALTRLCHETQVTQYMALLCLFALTLGGYSGQEDVVIGSPIANRTQPEMSGVVGFFANTLALRLRWGQQISMNELLRNVRSVCLAAYTHQDVPFEKLVADLRPVRDLSRNPLFDVMFSLEQSERKTLPPLGGLHLEAIESQTPDAKFDLTLSMVEDQGRFSGTVIYNPALFEADTIQGFLASFTHLLEQTGTDLTIPVGRLSLLDSAERTRILHTWNATQIAVPQTTMNALFEAQVQRSPEAMAVVAADTALTYAQLDDRANVLAQHLTFLGVGPEQVVGLFLDRSAAMLVALLGVLKAGAAYLPLDPTYPNERLTYMLTQAGVQVMVTTSSLSKQLPLYEARVVNLDHLQLERATAPTVALEPTNMAYVLFTSGSTGQPKGVQISHASLVNYTCSIVERLQFDHPMQFAFLQPFTVDLGNTALFAALVTGGTLHIIAGEDTADSTYLAEYFAVHAIDVLKITPTHFAALQSIALVMPRQRLIFGGRVNLVCRAGKIKGKRPRVSDL